MNMIISFEPKPISTLREGNMVRSEWGATRVMSVRTENGITTIERFFGPDIQMGAHQMIDVMA